MAAGRRGGSVIDRRSWLRAGLVLAHVACRRRAGDPEAGLDARRAVGITTEGERTEGPIAALDAEFEADAPSADAEPSIAAAPYPPDAAKELVAGGALAVHDWSLPGDAKLARRAVVLVPTHLAKGERVPLLILLHGLAETATEELGAYAWLRRYGVALGYAHLRARETITKAGLGGMATEERCAEIRSALVARPYRGCVIACLYTPNHWKIGPSPEIVLDRYARWIDETLIPRLVETTPIDGRIGIDGVSLGGYSSLGVGLRLIERIDALGCVQAAVSSGDAGAWAERIGKAFGKAGARPLHLLTSTQDVFRAPVEALSQALRKRAIDHDLRIAIGPHDQPFLRGPGSLEMLWWHAHALRSPA
jgi:enterochelin esterase-like enzyme